MHNSIDILHLVCYINTVRKEVMKMDPEMITALLNLITAIIQLATAIALIKASKKS